MASAAARLTRQPAPTRRSKIARIVPAPPHESQRSGLAIVVGVVAFIVLLVCASIFINTQCAVLAYDTHDKEVRLAQVRQDNQQLRIEIDEASSSRHLREVAEEQGMVPAGTTGYLTLADKKIEGGEAAEKPQADDAAAGTEKAGATAAATDSKESGQ